MSCWSTPRNRGPALDTFGGPASLEGRILGSTRSTESTSEGPEFEVWQLRQKVCLLRLYMNKALFGTIIDYNNLVYEHRLYKLVYKNNLGGHVWRPDYINCKPAFKLCNDMFALCFFFRWENGAVAVPCK